MMTEEEQQAADRQIIAGIQRMNEREKNISLISKWCYDNPDDDWAKASRPLVVEKALRDRSAREDL
jgi:hypothetical protein